MAATLTVIAGLGGPGCTEVNGGAVDLSWSLERLDGRRVKCLAARVAKVQLEWNVDGVVSNQSWPCEDITAVTRFSVPAGQAYLSVAPVCIDGMVPPADTFEAPAPLVRTIEVGEVVTLNTVLIMVDTDCICFSDGRACQ